MNMLSALKHSWYHFLVLRGCRSDLTSGHFVSFAAGKTITLLVQLGRVVSGRQMKKQKNIRQKDSLSSSLKPTFERLGATFMSYGIQISSATRAVSVIMSGLRLRNRIQAKKKNIQASSQLLHSNHSSAIARTISLMKPARNWTTRNVQMFVFD